MATYDPKYIQDYSAKLYQQAKSAPTLYFFIGMLLGILAFGAIGFMLLGTYDLIIIAIGVLTGAILGISWGRDRASGLKLQAQLALCQVQIEHNSRH